ncbi:GAF and ANTAR domain-containing protein [Kineococcus auxinigenes]|uniref:GAF and ANTAR domain-containing protein n=1 Tax=Kineococcus sp. SYSU DK010 TaxID=3383131 RepID=UPI003D7E4FFE
MSQPASRRPAPEMSAPGSATPGEHDNTPVGASPAADSGDDVLQALVQLTQLAQLPAQEIGTREVLAHLARVVQHAIGAAHWCSVLLGDPLQPEHVAADSRSAQQVDGAQDASGQGPSIDAYHRRLPVLAEDLSDDPRWPYLAAHLRAHADTVPARSALAVPVTVDATANGTLNGQVVGVLSLYSPRCGAFSSADELDLALNVATIAAAVVATQRRVEQERSTAQNLRIAMSSRAPIEQAKGLVAAWLSCGIEEAFAVMAAMSQDRNVKVRDLAQMLVSEPAAADLRQVLCAQHHKLNARRSAPDGPAHRSTGTCPAAAARARSRHPTTGS